MAPFQEVQYWEVSKGPNLFTACSFEYSGLQRLLVASGNQLLSLGSEWGNFSLQETALAGVPDDADVVSISGFVTQVGRSADDNEKQPVVVVAYTRTPVEQQAAAAAEALSPPVTPNSSMQSPSFSFDSGAGRAWRSESGRSLGRQTTDEQSAPEEQAKATECHMHVYAGNSQTTHDASDLGSLMQSMPQVMDLDYTPFSIGNALVPVRGGTASGHFMVVCGEDGGVQFFRQRKHPSGRASHHRAREGSAEVLMPGEFEESAAAANSAAESEDYAMPHSAIGSSDESIGSPVGAVLAPSVPDSAASSANGGALEAADEEEEEDEDEDEDEEEDEEEDEDEDEDVSGKDTHSESSLRGLTGRGDVTSVLAHASAASGSGSGSGSSSNSTTSQSSDSSSSPRGPIGGGPWRHSRPSSRSSNSSWSGMEGASAAYRVRRRQSAQTADTEESMQTRPTFELVQPDRAPVGGLDLSSPVLSFKAQPLENVREGGAQLFAAGCEDGTLRVVSKRREHAADTATAVFNGPLPCLTLVETDRGADCMDVVVGGSLGFAAVVECSMLGDGVQLGEPRVLPGSTAHDSVLCCKAADVNWDGREEVLLGTYGQRLLAYGQAGEGRALAEGVASSGDYAKTWERPFAYPIYSVEAGDFNQDGAEELVVNTMRGVHILQPDLNKAADAILVSIQALEEVRRLQAQHQAPSRLVDL